ncbi:hypothetical protein AVEN_74806-1 [Araneus ventricosus]|uniref:Uncharacterized protein n=1 Tax=Araneus ventricosus TaxID=182803 RepID=A0A4Y2HP70_ARAVE|nr:hypothetical protein AVEN_74806-1 [Araneus ventricosus]
MSLTSSVCKHTPISVCRHFVGNIDLPIQGNKTRQFRPCVQGLAGDDTFIREYTRKSREEHCRCLQKGNGKFRDLQSSDIAFLSLLLRFYLYLFYYRRESLPGPRAVNNSLYHHIMHTPELGVGTRTREGPGRNGSLSVTTMVCKRI